MTFEDFCKEHRATIIKMIRAGEFDAEKLEVLEAFGMDTKGEVEDGKYKIQD